MILDPSRISVLRRKTKTTIIHRGEDREEQAKGTAPVANFQILLFNKGGSRDNSGADGPPYLDCQTVLYAL